MPCAGSTPFRKGVASDKSEPLLFPLAPCELAIVPFGSDSAWLPLSSLLSPSRAMFYRTVADAPLIFSFRLTMFLCGRWTSPALASRFPFLFKRRCVVLGIYSTGAVCGFDVTSFFNALQEVV